MGRRVGLDAGSISDERASCRSAVPPVSFASQAKRRATRGACHFENSESDTLGTHQLLEHCFEVSPGLALKKAGSIDESVFEW